MKETSFFKLDNIYYVTLCYEGRENPDMNIVFEFVVLWSRIGMPKIALIKLTFDSDASNRSNQFIKKLKKSITYKNFSNTLIS